MSISKGFGVVGVLAALLAVPAVAGAITLDTPSMAPVGDGPSYISIDVQAGASGTPYGFTIEWMSKADFDLYGWPTNYTPPGFNYCTFDGVPTLNVTPGIANFLLPGGATAKIVLGELFDETGMYSTYLDEMAAETQYAVRVRAEGGPNATASGNSGTLIVSSGIHEVCRFTQGYWKNHASAWPVTSLTLGTVLYTQAQLLSILNTPAGGNGLLILAHQLIAAKLNVLLSPPPPSVAADIASADALIGGLVCPPIGSGFLSPSSVTTLESDLDTFNNGQTGGDSCTGTPTEHTSWGKLKSLYR